MGLKTLKELECEFHLDCLATDHSSAAVQTRLDKLDKFEPVEPSKLEPLKFLRMTAAQHSPQISETEIEQDLPETVKLAKILDSLELGFDVNPIQPIPEPSLGLSAVTPQAQPIAVQLPASVPVPVIETPAKVMELAAVSSAGVVPPQAQPVAVQQTQPIQPLESIEPMESMEPETHTRPLSTKAGKTVKSKKSKEQEQETVNSGKKRNIITVISDIIFYVAISIVLIAALSSSSSAGSPRRIFGYSYFTVLTGSMQKEIPRGSFILVKQTDPATLQVGDNITYMKDQSTSITHKIVNIYENYLDGGERGFQTQGTNNTAPDKDIVYEVNIVGKVILTMPGLGSALAYLGANIYIVFVIFGLCILLSFALRGIFAKPSPKPAVATQNRG